jgi:hypothetical protein
MTARTAALRTRQTASWRERRCFCCGVTIADGGGMVHADLGITTHRDICGAMVMATRRIYDRSVRGRWRPRREVLALVFQAIEPALPPLLRWDFEAQVVAGQFSAANLLRELDALERRA